MDRTETLYFTDSVVELEVSEDGKTAWLNVNGFPRVQISRPKGITIKYNRPSPYEHVEGAVSLDAALKLAEENEK